MDYRLSEWFRTETERLFSFITEGGRFTGPSFKVDEGLAVTTATYQATNMAIELALDERALAVDCRVVKVVSGRMATGYTRGESGAIVAMGLYQLLVNRGLRTVPYRPLRKLDPARRVTVQLEDHARLLREHGQAVTDDEPDLIQDYPGPMPVERF